MLRLVTDPATTRKIEVLFGHICHGWHRQLQVDAQYTTVLREPLARIASLYDYIRINDTHYLHRLAKSMSFVEFVVSGATETVDNAMVRQLCGMDTFTKGQAHDMRIPFGEVTEEHLKAAKETIRSAPVVGVMDRYQQYQDKLADYMNWPREPMQRANVGYRRTNPSDWRVVKDYLELDYELYEYARGLAA
jgi:hypothetical protein